MEFSDDVELEGSLLLFLLAEGIRRLGLLAIVMAGVVAACVAGVNVNADVREKVRRQATITAPSVRRAIFLTLTDGWTAVLSSLMCRGIAARLIIIRGLLFAIPILDFSLSLMMVRRRGASLSSSAFTGARS